MNGIQSLDLDTVFTRCLMVYLRDSNKLGIYSPDQPSKAASEWLDEEAGIFVLRNCRGELGRSKVRAGKSDRLTRI
jgi:hypothetical protein